MTEKDRRDDFDIGTKLRAARLRQDLSLRQLASKAEVSASLLSQIENGKANPSVRSLHSIADALSIPVDYFFPSTGPDAERQTYKATGKAEMTASEMRVNRSGSSVDSLDSRSERQDSKPSRPFLQASERLTIELQGDVTWSRLTPEPEDNVEFLEICYQVGASSGEKMSHHKGREFGLILEGELLLELGFESYRLNVGDSIVFDSTTPHRLTNAGEVPVKAIWVVMDSR